jgi:itaconate CoA-transferase
VKRVEYRDLTDKIVTEAFLQRISDQALADLTKADVAFALLNDMAGLSAHPELRRITVETPNGPVTYPAPASRFDGVMRPVGPVPELDEGV